MEVQPRLQLRRVCKVVNPSYIVCHLGKNPYGCMDDLTYEKTPPGLLALWLPGLFALASWPSPPSLCLLTCWSLFPGPSLGFQGWLRGLTYGCSNANIDRCIAKQNSPCILQDILPLRLMTKNVDLLSTLLFRPFCWLFKSVGLLRGRKPPRSNIAPQ